MNKSKIFIFIIIFFSYLTPIFGFENFYEEGKKKI